MLSPVELMQSIGTAIVRFIRSLLGPWVRSISESQRARSRSRGGQIEAWREIVAGIDFCDEASLKCFLASAEYSSLRQYMQDSTIEKVEKDRTIYIGGARGKDVRKHMLLDEIARLEKEWGLL